MSQPPLVLDASVAINLLATGAAVEVLEALPFRAVVVDVTSREVLRNPLEPKATVGALAGLAGRGLVVLTPLPREAVPRFVEFVSAAPPDDLDDGEAGALATGEYLDARVAIDERKGRRVAAARLPSVELTSSIGLLREPAVASRLGSRLADAVHSALLHARMRVLEFDAAWVRTLLGEERASTCTSLRRRT